jgi:hypothetical protein
VGRKEKCKAQKRDYTVHVSQREMKFSFKKQPKGISFFTAKTGGGIHKGKEIITSLFSAYFPSLMKTS